MRYYKATFVDGRITKRGTASREYTHAWRVNNGHGFASSEQLARKAAASWWTANPDVAREVVPVEEITAAEYRNLRA